MRRQTKIQHNLIGHRSGKGRVRVKRVVGRGFWRNLRKFARRSGDFLINNKAVGADILRQLGPHVLTLLASKAGEKASKAGVPDSVINNLAGKVQEQAKILGESKGEELSPNQKLVSGFVNQQSQQILDQILKRTGNGAKQLGSGSILLGDGSRLLGSGNDGPFVKTPQKI